jgi:hypothetical protein
VKAPFHIVCFVLNIFLPGIGTIVAACCASDKGDIAPNVIFGLIQLICAVMVFGWVWSVIWGYLIYRRGSGLMKLVPDSII